MREFIYGALVMASAIVGLFFLRFWRRSRDRLFLYFAFAFWILSLNWLLISFVARDESQAAVYAIRLLAFALVVLGILDKNRKPSC
jgi:hypothetical protein